MISELPVDFDRHHILVDVWACVWPNPPPFLSWLWLTKLETAGGRPARDGTVGVGGACGILSAYPGLTTGIDRLCPIADLNRPL